MSEPMIPKSQKDHLTALEIENLEDMLVAHGIKRVSLVHILIKTFTDGLRCIFLLMVGFQLIQIFLIRILHMTIINILEWWKITFWLHKYVEDHQDI